MVTTHLNSHRTCVGNDRGFTYLALLIAIAILGVGLTAASEVWVTTARHRKMVELEWIGNQFARALGSYYAASPGLVKTNPATLEDLLEDRRYLTVRRHLREVYLNPFTGKADWELVLGVDGKVRGVTARIPGEGGTVVREFVRAEL
ncbi:MAG: type II secretion system protein [Planctomycetes bacterium]|nr:type II secretion system protein [Planctomycetota bacterium]